MLFAMPLAFVSCSDDDDDDNDGPGNGGNVEDVLPTGRPVAVSDISNMVYDLEGRLVSCKWDENSSVKLTYSGKKVQMEMTDEDGEREYVTGTIGKSGYIESFEFTEDNEKMTFNFEYNSNGQLAGYNYKNKYGRENLKITYENGDITKVVDSGEDFEDGDKYVDEYYITYTDSKVTTPIENKSGIMLFDECYGIDLDETLVFYYAGLLGKSTKHYPVGLKSDEGTEKSESQFTWEFNSKGQPTSVKISETYIWNGNPSSTYETVEYFVW